MKTLSLSALLALSAMTAVPATAQTRTTAPSAARSTAAKPAATVGKSTTAAKTAAKPATTKTVAAKPAPAAQPPAVEETAPAAPAAAAPAKATAKPKATSQGHEFGVGSTAANLGVGFGLGYGYGIFGGVRSTPALSLSVERGIIDNIGPGVISVGGLVGYKSYSWKSGSYKGSWKNFIVSARGAYHYNILENPKLDTYAGLSLGVRVESYSDNWSNEQYRNDYGGATLTSGVFLGARYMLTDNLGAFGELGYDMSYLKLGLTARF
ncbi:hypothetical protein GCM10027048_37120 [Hymenobacter coalescens]